MAIDLSKGIIPPFTRVVKLIEEGETRRIPCINVDYTEKAYHLIDELVYRMVYDYMNVRLPECYPRCGHSGTCSSPKKKSLRNKDYSFVVEQIIGVEVAQEIKYIVDHLWNLTVALVNLLLGNREVSNSDIDLEYASRDGFYLIRLGSAIVYLVEKVGDYDVNGVVKLDRYLRPSLHTDLLIYAHESRLQGHQIDSIVAINFMANSILVQDISDLDLVPLKNFLLCGKINNLYVRYSH